MIYIGIDPGVHGGMVALDTDPSARIKLAISPMPSSLTDIWNWIIAHYGDPVNVRANVFAVIEKVGGFMGAHKGEEKYATGANVASGHTMFRFGANYGALCMALTAARIPWEEVLPTKWQKALNISPRKKGESKSIHKGRIKARAQALYPSVKVTLDIADALCIATYCQRKREGKLG